MRSTLTVAFDEHRGAPAKSRDDDVRSADEGFEVVASGQPSRRCQAGWANGLPHPFAVALPLRGASPSGDGSPGASCAFVGPRPRKRLCRRTTAFAISLFKGPTVDRPGGRLGSHARPIRG